MIGGKEHEKNMFHEVQKYTRTTEYQLRHVYTEHPVSVNGMTYDIVSVVPFPDMDYQLEDVDDKLKYLINGGKS